MAVVGTDRFLHVVLKQQGGARGVTLVGEETRAMSSVAGADVWVTGSRLPNGDLQVTRFVVRAVDGAPATDGTLVLLGAQYYIVTADSARHLINNLPDVLRQQVGKRVWATGQLAQGPVTFGVIQ